MRPLPSWQSAASERRTARAGDPVFAGIGGDRRAGGTCGRPEGLADGESGLGSVAKDCEGRGGGGVLAPASGWCTCPALPIALPGCCSGHPQRPFPPQSRVSAGLEDWLVDREFVSWVCLTWRAGLSTWWSAAVRSAVMETLWPAPPVQPPRAPAMGHQRAFRGFPLP